MNVIVLATPNSYIKDIEQRLSEAKSPIKVTCLTHDDD